MEVISLDLETTGLSVARDRIVEFGLVKQGADGVRTYLSRLVNPTIPIPASAQAIHGITNDQVKFAPTFKQLAPELLAFLDSSPKAILCGHNIQKFDLPLLQAELARAGCKTIDLSKRQVADSLVLFRKMEPHTLGKAVEFYCGTTFESKHRAQHDAEAALDVWLHQQKRYKNNSNQTTSSSTLKTKKEEWVDAEGRLRFGKHKGRLLAEAKELDAPYIRWLSRHADLPN